MDRNQMIGIKGKELKDRNPKLDRNQREESRARYQRDDIKGNGINGMKSKERNQWDEIKGMNQRDRIKGMEPKGRNQMNGTKGKEPKG